MAKDYSVTARKLVNALGGEGNITSLTHCMTRLRFILKDEAIIDDETVKAISGVMGVMKKAGQYQVIIGNDVQVCYNEVLKLGNFAAESKGEKGGKEKLTPGVIGNRVLDAITGSLSPLLPAILGCGMIKLLNIILNMAGVPETNMTYQLLNILGDAGFYFLPIMLAYTASRKFGCTPAIAMTVTAVLLHPELAAMFAGEAPVNFIGLPVTAASYASSVIPALLIAWIMSYVEKLVDKITPGWTKTILKPMLTLLIMLPLALVILAPAGNLIGNGLQFGLSWLHERAGWLTMLLLSAGMPFIVMTGMHQAFTAPIVKSLGTVGYDNMLLPAMLASNLAQGAACLAVSIRSKDTELKSVSGASAVSAMVAGITEPAMYGVTLRLKKPLMAACMGAGLSGLFIGVIDLKSYALVSPGFLSIIQFLSPAGGINFIYALIAAVISVVVTFVATLILGWEDPAAAAEDAEDRGVVLTDSTENFVAASAGTDGKAKKKHIIIESPVPGKVVPLETVPDETFSSGILGKGFAVEPSEGKVYAPFDGVCETIMDTLHAMALTADNGVSILIHVGLETVGLGGKPFKAHVHTGDRVKKGQLLLEFDIDEIKNSGCETIVPVLAVNGAEFGNVTIENNTMIIGG